MVKLYEPRQTTLVALVCVCTVLGLVLGRFIAVPMVSIFVLSVVWFVSYRKKRVFAWLLLCMLAVAIGVWRGHGIFAKVKDTKSYYGKPIIIESTAISDGIYADKGQTEFDVGSVSLPEVDNKPLYGTMRVRAYGVTSVLRGDRVRVEAKLFPTRGARQGNMSFASVVVLSRSSSVLELIRRKFVSGMSNALPEPLAPFAVGLLLGARSSLPASTSKQLSMVGLTHLVAVSGYNLTILVRAASSFGKKRSRYQTLLFSLLLIFGFMLLTGFSASIVRAGLVSVLGLLAWFYGRKFRPIVLITLAAALTAMYNPIYLWSDIGWYLSFLAFFGILVLAPLLSARLKMPLKGKIVGQLLIEAVCAQIMTLPLIMYIFGEVSLVALLANALVVPMVPLAMLVSFVAGLSGMIVPAISGFFALPARLVLTYTLDTVTILSGIPHVFVQRAINVSGLCILYICLALICIALSKYSYKKSGTITGIDFDDIEGVA